MILSNFGAREDSWESLGQQGDQTTQPWIFIGKNDAEAEWSSSTLATWCEEPTHGKNPDAGKDWRQKEEGAAEDEMVR